jgi:predicted nicotinamide N-methyase
MEPSTLEPRTFIRDNTALLSPGLVPELKLHLAVETAEIWEKTEEALNQLGLPPPFWAFAWAGGQALARYCLDHAATISGCRVLDFAAGGAVAGIATARAGASDVLASEVDRFAIAAIEENAAANSVTLRTRLADLVGVDEGWDVVLAGDVYYEDTLAADITDWLLGLAHRGANVLIGDPGRAFLPKEKLDQLAQYTVPVERDLEDQDVRYAKVWKFKT